MTPFLYFQRPILSLKTGVLCLLLLCLNRMDAQPIELMPVPEDSAGLYSYRSGTPIVYKDVLYLEYYSSNYNYVLVGYDGQNYSIHHAPAGFNGSNKGYQGKPLIYHDKLYLHYRDNNWVDYLAVFDGMELKMVDFPEGYTLSQGGAYPFIYQDQLYLHGISENGTGTLMAFDGQNFQPVAVPSDYQGANRGYFPGTATILGDTLFLTFRKKGNNRDLAYMVNGVLKFIPNLPGYDGNYRGYDGIAFSYAGKIFARYQNNAGGYDLGILEQDSLRFQTVPDQLGGADGLQSLSNATLLGDQLLLQFQSTEGNFVLGSYQDDSFSLIPSPPGFDSAWAGVQGRPLVQEGKAYFVFYNNDNHTRTLIYDGTKLSPVDMPGNDEDAGLGFDETFYLIDGKIYTAYTKDNLNQLAVLEGDQVSLYEHPSVEASTRSFYGPIILYQGDMYFKYALNGNLGVLAKLDKITPVQAKPDFSSQLKVYPNPTSGRQITIALEHEGDGPVQVQLYALDGRLLQTTVAMHAGSGFETRLDLSGLPAGTYLVRTFRAGRFQAVDKIVLLD